MEMDSKKFIDMLRNVDVEPRSYSGRGMHGRSCVSVHVDGGLVLGLGARIVSAESRGLDVEDIDVDDALDEIGTIADAVADVMDRASSDSLGRGSVIYWPHLDWPEDEPEVDDDDD